MYKDLGRSAVEAYLCDIGPVVVEINEVCIHLMVKGVPFGGVGHSGMGAYHGEWGFREFTHASTVLKGSTHMNLSLREHPYKDKKILSLLRLLEK